MRGWKLAGWVCVLAVMVVQAGCLWEEATRDTVHERWMVSLDRATLTADKVVVLSGHYTEEGQKGGPANFRLQVPVRVLEDPFAPGSEDWRLSKVYKDKKATEPGSVNGLTVLARSEAADLAAYPVVMQPGDQRDHGARDQVLEITRLPMPASPRELKLPATRDSTSDYHRLSQGLVKARELPGDIPYDPKGPVFFRRSYGKGSIEVFCVTPVPESEFYQVTMLVLSPWFSKEDLWLLPAVPMAVGAGAAAEVYLFTKETPEERKAREEKMRDE